MRFTSSDLSAEGLDDTTGVGDAGDDVVGILSFLDATVGVMGSTEDFSVIEGIKESTFECDDLVLFPVVDSVVSTTTEPETEMAEPDLLLARSVAGEEGPGEVETVDPFGKLLLLLDRDESVGDEGARVGAAADEVVVVAEVTTNLFGVVAVVIEVMGGSPIPEELFVALELLLLLLLLLPLSTLMLFTPVVDVVMGEMEFDCGDTDKVVVFVFVFVAEMAWFP